MARFIHSVGKQQRDPATNLINCPEMCCIRYSRRGPARPGHVWGGRGRGAGAVALTCGDSALQPYTVAMAMVWSLRRHFLANFVLQHDAVSSLVCLLRESRGEMMMIMMMIDIDDDD